MLTFCIPKNLVDGFLNKLKSGEVDPNKLAEMTSEDRRNYFSGLFGENVSHQVNALFESKLLLKNQQKGFVDWAKKLVGLNEQSRRDIINRVERMTEALTPANEKAFLEDIVAKRLGVQVTTEQAAEIVRLAKQVTESESKVVKDSPIASDSRMEYGRARYDFDKYFGDLKTAAEGMRLRDYLFPDNWIRGLANFAGLTKSLVASLDNSVIGRQGLKVLFSEPDIWLKESAQTFVDIYRTFKGENVFREIAADVLSRPNAIEGLYRKQGLAVNVREEAYPVSLPSKIPILGTLFKASEAAFTGFQYRTRADIFDRYYEIAQKTGAGTEGIAKIANSLTGRSSLGFAEKGADLTNALFFSPRFVKSNLDIITNPLRLLGQNPETEFARRQAAFNTVKTIGGIAAILAIAKAVNPDSVEENPLSSDFGKLRFGHIRIDVSGGIAPLVTLAFRLQSAQSKSSITGITSEPNPSKRLDYIMNFIEGKASPVLRTAIIDLAKGKDFQGKKPTLANSFQKLVEPIGLQTAYDLYKDTSIEASTKVASYLADFLGFGANTYSAEVNWETSESKKIKQFQEKVGSDKFKEANDKFNKKYSSRIDEIVASPTYNNLSNDDKIRIVNREKNKILESIFKEYKFNYREEKASRLPKI